MDAIRRLNTFHLKGYPSSLKNECIHHWSDSTKLSYGLSDNFSQHLFVHASQVWIANVESNQSTVWMVCSIVMIKIPTGLQRSTCTVICLFFSIQWFAEIERNFLGLFPYVWGPKIVLNRIVFWTECSEFFITFYHIFWIFFRIVFWTISRQIISYLAVSEPKYTFSKPLDGLRTHVQL